MVKPLSTCTTTIDRQRDRLWGGRTEVVKLLRHVLTRSTLPAHHLGALISIIQEYDDCKFQSSLLLISLLLSFLSVQNRLARLDLDIQSVDCCESAW